MSSTNLQIANEVFKDEMVAFKQEVRSFEDGTFYVYSLCYENGRPFYIGKGTKDRAYHHLMPFWYNKDNSLKNQVIRELLSSEEPPIINIIKSGLSEKDALELEKQQIDLYGRIFDGGTLTNIAKGGVYEGDAELRKNVGKLAGMTCYLTQSGIHGASKELRSEWAKVGAEALNTYGKRGGTCSSEWISENKEYHKEICSRAGKKGGKARKGWKFWNNGVEDKIAPECPGEGWILGRLKSKMNKNSFSNLTTPAWTNGFINKNSHTKPDHGFFRGQRRKMKSGEILIIVNNSNDQSDIPNWLKHGHNYFTQKEIELYEFS